VKLCIGLFFVISLTGCIGENYDFTPPTVTINDDLLNEELEEAHIDWKGENGKQLEKETEDILAFAKQQEKFHVTSGQKVDLLFDSEDFAVEELLVSVWKDPEDVAGTTLELNDDRSFHFPKEQGEYVIVVDLRTDRGIAQYVGHVVIQNP
jgi:hypothetical protein